MPPNAASSDELADWHMHSVLVVDDEPGMVNFLRRALAARCGAVCFGGCLLGFARSGAGHGGFDGGALGVVAWRRSGRGGVCLGGGL